MTLKSLPRRRRLKKIRQEEESDESDYSDDAEAINPDDLAEADDIVVDDTDEDAVEVDAWQEGKVPEDAADGDGSREPGAQPKNGYGELVRLGRTRGWVTTSTTISPRVRCARRKTSRK